MGIGVLAPAFPGAIVFIVIASFARIKRGMAGGGPGEGVLDIGHRVSPCFMNHNMLWFNAVAG
jgi:hypothetical protein